MLYGSYVMGSHVWPVKTSSSVMLDSGDGSSQGIAVE